MRTDTDCQQPVATPTSDRGAKPKYRDDASHNPLIAHRERRKREAEAERDQARDDREQADAAAAQAITTDELQDELPTLHNTTAEQISQIRAETAAELQEAARAQQAEAAAQQRRPGPDPGHRGIALVRADSQRERDEHRAATDARLAALEEIRTALRIRDKMGKWRGTTLKRSCLCGQESRSSRWRRLLSEVRRKAGTVNHRPGRSPGLPDFPATSGR